MKRSPQEISTVFTDLLREQLGIEPTDITPAAYLSPDDVPEQQRGELPALGADSLDLVELVMNVELEFGIDITDKDAQKLHTVQDWLTYIESNVFP